MKDGHGGIRRRRLKQWRLSSARALLALTLCLFGYGAVAASAPGPELGPGAFGTHLLSAILIGFLCRMSGGSLRSGLWIVGFAAALTIVSEFVQLAVPGRYPGLLDGAANLLGLAAGFALACVDRLRLRRFLS